MDQKYSTFPGPIGNAKETGDIEYNIKYLLVEYHHNTSNSFLFSNLAYALTAPG